MFLSINAELSVHVRTPDVHLCVLDFVRLLMPLLARRTRNIRQVAFSGSCELLHPRLLKLVLHRLELVAVVRISQVTILLIIGMI